MAEDPNQAQEEEAAPTPQEQEGKAGRPGRRGRKVAKPVSLFPLTFEEAVEGLLKVNFDPGEDKEAGS